MSSRRRTKSAGAVKKQTVTKKPPKAIRASSAPAKVTKGELSYVPAEHNDFIDHKGKLLLHKIEIQHYDFFDNDNWRDPNPYCIPPDKFEGFLMRECELKGENTAIKGRAFVNCPNLEIVTFPRISLFFTYREVVVEDGVRQGYQTYGIFHNCPKLKKVIILGTYNSFREVKTMICEPEPGQVIDPYCDSLKIRLEAGIQTTFMHETKTISCIWDWPNNNPREMDHQRIITTFPGLELFFTTLGGDIITLILPDEECDILDLLKTTRPDLPTFEGIMNPFLHQDPFPMTHLSTRIIGNHLKNKDVLVTEFTLMYLGGEKKAPMKRRRASAGFIKSKKKTSKGRRASKGGGKYKRNNYCN